MDFSRRLLLLLLLLLLPIFRRNFFSNLFLFFFTSFPAFRYTEYVPEPPASSRQGSLLYTLDVNQSGCEGEGAATPLLHLRSSPYPPSAVGGLLLLYKVELRT
ncbi:Hypothetical protein NTJ_02458 [Nesidiocoris tenuis]|uniref:Secreted protein n=1 Tax=Nesidiocoris tenuis TaxID=355587 RepID=A0ABN7ABF7_9HEMI|nr:Hypothetical protein NTJ_02458 [Nesidiocoris tenuis]